MLSRYFHVVEKGELALGPHLKKQQVSVYGVVHVVSMYLGIPLDHHTTTPSRPTENDIPFSIRHSFTYLPCPALPYFA